MKKQKINKKRIFVAFGLGVTLGSLFINPMNNANACAIEQPSGVSFSKSYGDLRVIHNRLVDEDIIGYNYNNLYTFYDYDGGWKLDENSGLSAFGSYTDKFHSDLVAFVSLDGTNDDLKKSAMSQLGNYTSTTYSELKIYTSFNSPVNNINKNNNFSINKEILVCDVAKLGQITGGVFDKTDSASKDAAREVINSIYIVEYVFRSYGTGYDNELTIQNDGDIINEGISFVSKSSYLKTIDSTNFSLINDKKYTFWQIKNMIGAYDGAGNTVDEIYRDYDAEEELRSKGNIIYKENDVKVGTQYMCLCSYDYKENKSTITIKIKTTIDNITEALAKTTLSVKTNKKSLNSKDAINLIGKVAGNVNDIIAISTNKVDYTNFESNFNFNNNTNVYLVFTTFDGDISSVEIKYDENYVESSIEDTDSNTNASNDKHWYDWFLKALIKFINWLCGK